MEYHSQVSVKPTSAQSVYLACGSTDLRKSIDGLAALVQEGFGLDPFSSCLFVFCNRDRFLMTEREAGRIAPAPG
ncbi:IS66 family insertion sequence element accessory protein TnpB [Paenibacillus sp. J2TS4]|uniref:IS66 family insertion sequence element accessory protein TnpB n=1 Tax=Paenibacillus sp. J2TS4 TaxID=2807194 RepID=UPI0035B536D6